MSWVDKDFEENMHQFINEIYENTFNNIKSIYRSDRNNENKTFDILDKDLGIDTIIIFENESKISFQEKSLRDKKKNFQQITLEYFNDPKTNDTGEWFKIIAQFYFFGYVNKEKNGYSQFFIINNALLKIALNDLSQENLNQYLQQNYPPNKANFFAIPFHLIKKLDKKYKGLIYTYYDTNNR